MVFECSGNGSDRADGGAEPLSLRPRHLSPLYARRSAQVTIVVEAIKSMVGASVLFNYDLNHEYSVARQQDAVCGKLLKK